MTEVFSIRMQLSAIERRPITREEFSKTLGVDPTTIRNWETGKTTPPSYLVEYLKTLLKKKKPVLAEPA